VQALKKQLPFAFALIAVFVALQVWQTWGLSSGKISAQILQMQSSLILNDGTDGTIEAIRFDQAIEKLQKDHPGKPIGLHVWAQWCSICKLEEHSISRVSADHPVLTIAMQSGPALQVAAHLSDRSLAWQAWVDPKAELATQLGVTAVPAFLVIDPRGNLTMPAVGYTTELGMRVRLWLAKYW